MDNDKQWVTDAELMGIIHPGTHRGGYPIRHLEKLTPTPEVGRMHQAIALAEPRIRKAALREAADVVGLHSPIQALKLRDMADEIEGVSDDQN